MNKGLIIILFSPVGVDYIFVRIFKKRNVIWQLFF